MNQDIEYKVKALADLLAKKGFLKESQEIYRLNKMADGGLTLGAIALIVAKWVGAGLLVGGAGATAYDIYTNNHGVLDQLLEGTEFEGSNFKRMTSKELEGLFNVYRDKLSDTDIVHFPSTLVWPKQGGGEVDEFFRMLASKFYDDSTSISSLTESWFESKIEEAFKNSDQEGQEPTFLDNEAFWANAFQIIVALRQSVAREEKRAGEFLKRVSAELGRPLTERETFIVGDEYAKGKRAKDAAEVARKIVETTPVVETTPASRSQTKVKPLQLDSPKDETPAKRRKEGPSGKPSTPSAKEPKSTKSSGSPLDYLDLK